MKPLRILTASLLIFFLGYFGLRASQYAMIYEKVTETLAQESDASGRVQGKVDQLTSLLTLGWVEDETKNKFDILSNEKHKMREYSFRYLYAFLAALTLLILLSFLCSKTAHALVLASSAFIVFIFGLINPILMVTIHKKVDYLGDVVLSFESKSIVSSIAKLFENGELIVALVILLFSVIIPLIKIITLMIALLAKQLHTPNKLVQFFHHLGKWSMLDVFVVSTFLVYLSSKDGDFTHAEVGIGLYFFLIYVLLSMVTTLQTQKVLMPKSPS